MNLDIIETIIDDLEREIKRDEQPISVKNALKLIEIIRFLLEEAK